MEFACLRPLCNRALKDGSPSSEIFDAKIPQLPLNEILQVFDSRKQVSIERGKIYRIHPRSYQEA